MTREDAHNLLLGDWACLGILYPTRTHGFAIAARLKPSGDIGRVWSLSRPLTYRSLDHLFAAGYAEPVGEEPGLAGGNRVILAATRRGRAQFRRWLGTPVVHLRDLRSELLLKLVLAEHCSIDVAPMLVDQRELLEAAAATLSEQCWGDGDVVALWRHESAQAALRFLDHVQPAR